MSLSETILNLLTLKRTSGWPKTIAHEPPTSAHPPPPPVLPEFSYSTLPHEIPQSTPQQTMRVVFANSTVKGARAIEHNDPGQTKSTAPAPAKPKLAMTSTRQPVTLGNFITTTHGGFAVEYSPQKQAAAKAAQTLTRAGIAPAKRQAFLGSLLVKVRHNAVTPPSSERTR